MILQQVKLGPWLAAALKAGVEKIEVGDVAAKMVLSEAIVPSQQVHQNQELVWHVPKPFELEDLELVTLVVEVACERVVVPALQPFPSKAKLNERGWLKTRQK